MKMYGLNFWKDVLNSWMEDKVTTLSAALAFFAAFSLGPVLILCTMVASIFFGKHTAEKQLLQQMTHLIGEQSTEQLNAMIAGLNATRFDTLTGIIAVIALILGASGFFGQLLESLNTIWCVKPQPVQIRVVLKRRLLSFILVVVMGLLLLISIGLSLFLKLFQPIIHMALLFQIFNFLFSLALITLLFLLLFKFLPDVTLETKDILTGAFFSALFYILGKFLLAWGLDHLHLTSKYGAASSFVVILFWLFYFGQVIFIGAEFIKINMQRKGRQINPAPHAICVK